jgi:hypothetical protein
LKVILFHERAVWGHEDITLARWPQCQRKALLWQFGLQRLNSVLVLFGCQFLQLQILFQCLLFLLQNRFWGLLRA